MALLQHCVRAAACAAGLAALSAAPTVAQAATHTVTTCADAGAGSLRSAVAAAASGDTIDLRSLACGRIVLTSGAIPVAQDTLVIRGPGHSRFSVSGNYQSSVFRHSGLGTLALRGLTIEQGQHRGHDANGGCIYSDGSVDGNDIVVRHCAVYAVRTALGGGIYAAGNITLFYSAVYSNGAKGAGTAGGGVVLGTLVPGALLNGNLRAHRTRFLDNTAGSGAAIRALGRVDITYSTIANNHARIAGAIDAFGPARIAYSTISGNTAGEQAAVFHLPPGSSIENSTISGNRAPFISIGYIVGPSTIANSTIVDNTSNPEIETNCFPGALVAWTDVRIESSILARNTCLGASGFDISGPPPSGRDPPPPPIVTGADNLIGRSALITLPADTITGVDPLLGPLTDNGGRTLTRMPAAGSPAIDRGNNALGLTVDQRGAGFLRTRGVRTDIGAVER